MNPLSLSLSFSLSLSQISFGIQYSKVIFYNISMSSQNKTTQQKILKYFFNLLESFLPVSHTGTVILSRIFSYINLHFFSSFFHSLNFLFSKFIIWVFEFLSTFVRSQEHNSIFCFCFLFFTSRSRIFFWPIILYFWREFCTTCFSSLSSLLFSLWLFLFWFCLFVFSFLLFHFLFLSEYSLCVCVYSFCLFSLVFIHFLSLSLSLSLHSGARVVGAC